MKLTPRTEAVAFRVWQDCQLHGWDRSAQDIVDSIGDLNVSLSAVVVAGKAKGWLKRWRKRHVPERLDNGQAFDFHRVPKTLMNDIVSSVVPKHMVDE